MLEVTGRPNILHLPVIPATRVFLSGSSQLVNGRADLFKLLGDLHLKPRWLITSLQSSSDVLNKQQISPLPLEQWPSALHLFMLPVWSFIVPSTLSLFVRHRHSFVAILWMSESLNNWKVSSTTRACVTCPGRAYTLKGKGKGRPITDRERTEWKERYNSTLSLTWTRDGGRWPTSRHRGFTPGKETRYTLHRRQRVCEEVYYVIEGTWHR